MAEDIGFKFDTKFFEKGIQRINKRFDNLKNIAGKVSSGVATGFQKMATKSLMLVGSLKGITKLFDQIPEIGKTFKIAKDIIFRNFLFPLRKAIFPMLQKFLDFIRDNRKTFVVWGAALADVFELVVGGLTDLFKVAQQLGQFFVGFINRTFGLQLKSFQDLINLTIFKIAVAIEFLKSVFPEVMDQITPLINLIADGIGGAITAVVSLLGGFLEGVSGIEKPLESILETIVSIGDEFTTIDETGNKTNRIFQTIGKTLGTMLKFVGDISDAFLNGMKPAIIAMETPFNRVADVFERLFGDTEKVSKWKTIFEGIGKIVGGTLLFAFDRIATVIDIIGLGIEALLDFLNQNSVQKTLDNVGDIFGAVGKFFVESDKAILNFLSGKKVGPGVNDAYIDKGGKVTPLSPEDNVLAFKGSPPGGGGVQIGNINLDFTGMTISMPAATQEEAEAVGFSIIDIVRNQLDKELVNVGAV